MDKLFKLTIMVCLLIISVSVLYYFVVFLPGQEETRRADVLNKERQAATAAIAVQQAEEEAKEAAKQTEEDAKNELNACLTGAESKYGTMWDEECRDLGKLTQQCEDALILTMPEYENKYGEFQGDDLFEQLAAFFEKQADCSCRLPTATSDRFSEIMANDKEEC